MISRGKGRPPRKDEPSYRRVNLRLTEQEYNLCSRAASRANLPLAEWFRSMNPLLTKPKNTQNSRENEDFYL